MKDYFDPQPEEQEIVLIDQAMIVRALRQVVACESCDLSSDLPFSIVLDRLTCRDPVRTDYVMERPAACPQCGEEILEATPVSCR